MNKEIVKSERLGESYSVFHHPSGLDVLVWKMEGFTTTEAIFYRAVCSQRAGHNRSGNKNVCRFS